MKPIIIFNTKIPANLPSGNYGSATLHTNPVSGNFTLYFNYQISA